MFFVHKHRTKKRTGRKKHSTFRFLVKVSLVMSAKLKKIGFHAIKLSFLTGRSY